MLTKKFFVGLTMISVLLSACKSGAHFREKSTAASHINSAPVTADFLLGKSIFPSYNYDLLVGEDFFKEINDFTTVSDNVLISPPRCRSYMDNVARSVHPYLEHGDILGISVKSANPQDKRYYYEAVIGGRISISDIAQEISGSCSHINYAVDNKDFGFIVYSSADNKIEKNNFTDNRNGLYFSRILHTKSMKKETHTFSKSGLQIVSKTAIVYVNKRTIIFQEKSLGTSRKPEPIDDEQFSDLVNKSIDQVKKQK